MMLKIGSEYLDFNSDIEMEEQIKLFEDLDKSAGDFSYEFDVNLTSENIRILQCPFPDNISKNVYHKITAFLTSNDGVPFNLGFIRIQRITGRTANCSFFSGNNNWFGLLSGQMSDIDLSAFDVDQTEANIAASWLQDEGVVFSLVDNGSLLSRGYRDLKLEDFVPGIYVKTVLKKIFQHHSIKINGELLSIPFYNSLIVQRNGRSNEQIEAGSSYVQKSSSTARPTENVAYKMTFQNDSVFPYFDGANDPFDLANSRWIAPARMRIHLEANFTPSIVDADYSQRIYVYINGVYTFVDIGLAFGTGGLYNAATNGAQAQFTMDRRFIVEQGDIVEIYTEWQQSTGSTQNDVLSGWLKITPEYIYKVYGDSVVPQWTQQEFVSNIFKVFNVLPSYEPYSKTLTLNVFEKMPSKDPFDISQFISSVETDYTEFISNFGRKNMFSYSQVDFEDLQQYNIQNFFKYGQGSIAVDNDFIEDSVDLVESDFSNPQGYINPAFDMSMERLNLIKLDEGDKVDITGVTGSLLDNQAIFGIDRDIFLVGDLVRISDSNNPNYNGDWIVDFISPGSIEVNGLFFDSDATGIITKLIHEYNETEDVYLMVNIPNYPLSDFSGRSSFHFETSNYTEMATAYFSLLDTGRNINDEFRQSLTFGPINSPFFYQKTILETYWHAVNLMLQDPVKLLCESYLPLTVYNQLNFLSPVRIVTVDTTNLYYVNRKTGYISSDKTCTLELIKLP